MAASEPILQYATPPAPKRVCFSGALIYAAFLSGLLYLVYVQAVDRAPMKVPALAWNAYGQIEAQLRLADADPHPAELLVLVDPQSADPAGSAIRLTRVYYMAQYLRYPHRLFIGQDDKIINGQEQLISEASHLPSAQWVRQHQVSEVYAVHEIGMGLLELVVRQIQRSF